MNIAQNRRIVLTRRTHEKPSADDFKLQTAAIEPLEDGHVLVENELLALDPGILVRLISSVSYAASYAPGDVIPGRGVGKVIESRHPDFAAGDTVVGSFGWQEFAQVDGAHVANWAFPDLPKAAALGPLGIPGLTAYFALVQLAQLRPGETVLISSAAGAVGSVAGQLAKHFGAKVIGVAGGPDKCAWLANELRFDQVIDYKNVKSLDAAVAAACPEGFDIFVDNVGGDILNAAIASAKTHGRLIISGAVAEYGHSEADRVGIRDVTSIVNKSLRIEGFIVFTYGGRFPEARAVIASLIRNGSIKMKLHVTDGLESAPSSFLGLFKGQNFGRSVVKLR
jgi:NADPH-dependent curcumin reductase